MQKSVHDNVLLSYTVDAKKAQIVLHTAYYDQERTDVIFLGVEAYDFECDNFQNILFDIEEVEPTSLYDKHLERFERLKNHGWPWISLEIKSRDELLHALRERGVRGFEISSTLGLEGWVWARSIEIRAT
jgi:phosphoglycolate phosphatase-like HAD superfamily hydrolase